MDTIIHVISAFFLGYGRLFMEMAPWLLFGFIFAGLIHAFLPMEKMRAFLGKPGFLSSLKAALFGVPLPLCSCGVIPAGIALHKNGASRSAAVSFLISTPQTGVDSILVTYSMLGLPFAVIRPIAAFLTGIIGGTLTGRAVPDTPANTSVTASQASESGDREEKTFTSVLRFIFIDFLGDIAGSLVVGLGIAALIAMAVPDDFFMQQVSSPLLQMLIMLAASVPMYVCATASVPIAAVLLMKGIAPGSVLVFLMAGPATNAATISVIRRSLGTRTFAVYLSTIIGSALLFGGMVNFLPSNWFISAMSMHEHHHDLLPGWMTGLSTLILGAALANYFIGKLIKRSKWKHKELPTMAYTTLEVHGMTCRHCKMNVENSLKKLEFITSAEADPDTDRVVIEGTDVDLPRVEATITEIGYEYRGVLN